MAEIQLSTSGSNVGVVWGQNMTFTGTAPLDVLGPSTVSEVSESTSAGVWEELKDPVTAKVQTVVIGDLKNEFTLNVTPSAATRALAKAKNIIPKPGDIVAITDAVCVENYSALSCIVKSATRQRSTGKQVVITMNLVKYEDALTKITG